jgi:hypothetical protein
VIWARIASIILYAAALVALLDIGGLPWPDDLPSFLWLMLGLAVFTVLDRAGDVVMERARNRRRDTMEAKALEVRDRATFLPVLAVRMVPACEGQGYLLRRCGYGSPAILLTALRGGERANVDPYEWGDRTYKVAHDHIEKNWAKLSDGDVICVETILGERTEPKKSGRVGG